MGTPPRRSRTAGGISDEAVEDATGRKWSTWFTILDRAGAAKRDHRGIVSILAEQHDVAPWWRQMITVAYEQARGLRAVHEKPGGYEIGRSKTVAVGVARLFEAWSDPSVRRVWLADPDFTVRKSTPDRSIRITWVDDLTDVDVYFWPKGGDKTQVSVQHKKLADPRAAERAKAYWSRQLDQLAGLFRG